MNVRFHGWQKEKNGLFVTRDRKRGGSKIERTFPKLYFVRGTHAINMTHYLYKKKLVKYFQKRDEMILMGKTRHT